MDKINKTAIIIPARLNSTRLKNKLLLEVNSKPIIQWVYESAKKSKLSKRVIIATDSEEIYGKAQNFGAEVEMTSAEHKSGSDRIAEVAKRHPEFEYILNMQGDEPQITPDVIDLALDLIQNTSCDISTLVREIKDTGKFKALIALNVFLIKILMLFIFQDIRCHTRETMNLQNIMLI